MTDGQAKPDATTQDAGGATFTQEQLDAIVRDRLARERGKYADYDDLKGKLAALESDKQAREDAEKTERQKELDTAIKAERKKADAEWETKLKQATLGSAIERELMKAGADPDGKLLMVGNYAIADESEVADKVAALLKDKPHLVLNAQRQAALGAAGTPASGKGQSGSGRTTVTTGRLTELRNTGKWVGSAEQKAYERGLLDVTD